MKRILLILTVVLLLFGLWWLLSRKPVLTQTTQSPTTTPVVKQVVTPISEASTRVTKKPFGIFITPKTSPVQPERFSGYHSGTDFETTPDEQNSEVPFFAICTGKVLAKRTATGYGGVFVQSCTINNQAVTVIYGHVSLKSISKNIGDSLAQGEQIGNLGHSPDETDGERKHLHLGIHLGTAINILGYVQKQSDLSAWLDFQKL